MLRNNVATLLPVTVLKAVAGGLPQLGCGTALTVGAPREGALALQLPCCWLSCPCAAAMIIPLHQQAWVMQPIIR